MTQPIENTRRQLGELAAMAGQTERAERQILERAEKRLTEVEQQLSDLRAGGQLHEDAPARQYQDAILERGRLHQVIAQARRVLGSEAGHAG